MRVKSGPYWVNTVTIIELEDIYKTYQLGEVAVPVLREVSFKIERGEFVALMGSSGSGKTTLLNLLGCLDRPSSGVYRLDGEEVSRLSNADLARVRSRRIGFVFQNFNLLPRISATDNVLMPTVYAGTHDTTAELRERSCDLLRSVGLGERLEHEPTQMSGGQQQRVAIARAMINRPALLLADEPTGNLDSTTGQEILAMFERLNRAGITIIMVTHDESVAEHASRVIRISDGGITGDSKTSEKAYYPQTLAAVQHSTGEENEATLSYFAPLHIIGTVVRIAVQALRRNLLRSALTTLGIIIGVSAVIAMMEISQGASNAIRQTILNMGANTLLVQPGVATRGGASLGGGSASSLTPEDAEALVREASSIRHAAPVVRARAQLVYGNHNWQPLYVVGTTPAFLSARDWTDLEEGSAFTERDIRSGSKVCLIGETVARELFGEQSPIGRVIRVQNAPFRVIGVLSRKGANLLGLDQDDIFIAPWTTIKHRVSGGRLNTSTQEAKLPNDQVSMTTYRMQGVRPRPTRMANIDQILVQAASTELVPTAMAEIARVLRDRHRLQADEKNDFRIKDMAEVSRTLKTTVNLLSGLLLSVALISLIVGGVGIMNIMLVSVTERTREIGLRMAVGASQHHILRQFLVEATVLCLLGGLVGILVGRGGSLLVRLLLEWPTQASLLAAVAAVAVSVSVGVGFGYYPAWKASRLDPIEALRYE